MTTVVSVVIWAGFAIMVVILAAVVGAVDRRERFAFTLGIGLILVGLSISDVGRSPSVAVVVVGFILAIASIVPLLRD